MKKSIKIVSILMMAIMLIMVATPVFANNTAATKPSDVAIDSSGTGAISNIGGKILGVIRTIGSIVAVGAIILLGIKYMMGSVEEKAEYKKSMIPYFIGCVILFAAVNLADMIYAWANTI